MYYKDNRAKIVLTFSALADLLQLPKDAEIFGIKMSQDDLAQSQFEIFMRHPSLPNWVEGMVLPTIPLEQLINRELEEPEKSSEIIGYETAQVL